MSKTILVDFDTEPGREFDDLRPIGVLLESLDPIGFTSRYLAAVTEEQDSGHDNYLRTMSAVEELRTGWEVGEPEAVTAASVVEFFVWLADNSYLGLRFRTLGMVDEAVTLDEAFDLYVVQASPLRVLSDEEFPIGRA